LNIKRGTIIQICHFNLTNKDIAFSVRQVCQVFSLQQDSLMLSEQMSEEHSPHWKLPAETQTGLRRAGPWWTSL